MCLESQVETNSESRQFGRTNEWTLDDLFEARKEGMVRERRV
jgi:hypothetical protein